MQITVSGKQVELSDALRARVSEQLVTVTGKYFHHVHDARVLFGRSRVGFTCAIDLHAGRGLTMRGEAEGADAYVAFEAAAGHIGKRLRRYRRRVNEHARSLGQRTQPGTAREVTLRAEPDDHEDEQHPAEAPAVIAETTTEIAHLSVSEAVMRMELGDQPVLMFRDTCSGVLNVVYRRPDGHIGWIDPHF